MNILITGATGFVGGHLARRSLLNGHKVRAICRDGDPPVGCEIVRGELEDPRTCQRAISEFRPDVIYHLAAQAIVPHAKLDPWGTFESNVRGTYNLLEAMRLMMHASHPRTAFIMASSDKAYGELPMGSAGYREDYALHGRGPYDCSKACADLIAQSYAHEYNLPVGIVRAGNIYGPGDPDQTRIIPSLVNDICCGKDPTIMSDGSPIRDYLWIDDAVDGYVLLADYVRYRRHEQQRAVPVNLSGGEPISVLELANLAIGIDIWNPRGLKPKLRPNVLGVRQGEIQRQVLDTTWARENLGWTPKVGLREGLWKMFCAWGMPRGGV